MNSAGLSAYRDRRSLACPTARKGSTNASQHGSPCVIGDDLWLRLARVFREEQLLDLLMLCGWYHAVSFTANGAQVSCEDGAPRFTDVAG